MNLREFLEASWEDQQRELEEPGVVDGLVRLYARAMRVHIPSLEEPKPEEPVLVSTAPDGFFGASKEFWDALNPPVPARALGVHNHPYDPSCREFYVCGTLKGECLQ